MVGFRGEKERYGRGHGREGVNANNKALRVVSELSRCWRSLRRRDSHGREGAIWWEELVESPQRYRSF